MIIGIAGKKRSGKDTAAKVFERLGFTHDSFAAPMKRCLESILGHELRDEDKEVPMDWLDGITPRKMLQTLGTEWGRCMVHSDLWVRSMMRRAPPMCVISDVRFENEAAAIRAAGGVIVHIYRRPMMSDSHISEAGVEFRDGDFIVHNAGTLSEFVNSVERVSEIILSEK